MKGKDEKDQLSAIMEVLGVPPKELIEKASRKDQLFNEDLTPKQLSSKVRIPGSKNLKSLLNCKDEKFLSFIKGCLTYDPEERLTPETAIVHEWILEALKKAPEDHLNLSVDSEKLM